MKTLISQITESGLPVRASFALAFLWLLVSGAINLYGSSFQQSHMDLAVYSIMGGAVILLSGLVLQKILENRLLAELY